MDGEIEAFDARWRCVSVAAANRLEPLRLHQNGVSEVETWSEHAKKASVFSHFHPDTVLSCAPDPGIKVAFCEAPQMNKSKILGRIEWQPWQIYSDKNK